MASDLLEGLTPPPTLEQCIASAKRELTMRERVYPRQVMAGKMTPEKARHETACMTEIVRLLEGLASGGQSCT